MRARKPIVRPAKKNKVDWLRNLAKAQGVHREDVQTPEQRSRTLNDIVMGTEADAVMRAAQRQKRR